MHKVLMILLSAAIGSHTFSQSKASEILEKMNQLRLTESADGKISFQFDEKSGKLILNDLEIPVTDEVILKKEEDGSDYKVIFFFQNGKAVTKVNEPSWRRAHFELLLVRKKDAQAFITLYHELNSLI